MTGVVDPDGVPTAGRPRALHGGAPGRALARQLRRPAARVLVGSLLGQGLVLAASPLITRLYSPGDLGALAVVTALATIVGAVAPTGWDRAVAVPRGETAARLLVVLAVSSVLVVGVLATLASWAWRHDLARLTGTPALVALWWAVPLTIVVVALQRVATAWLARRRDYGALTRRSVLQGVGQLACTLGLAPLGGPAGLVLSVAAGRAASLLGSTGSRRPPDGLRSRRQPSRRLAGAVARRFRRFPLVATWSGLLNVAGQQAPLLLLAALHGSAALGALALTMRVLGAPVGMVADAVGLQVEGQLGALARARRGGLAAGLRRTLVPLAALGAVALVGTVVLAPSVFPVVFGAEWAGAGVAAVVLAPAFATQVVVSPLSRLLPLLEQQGTQLVWDASRMVATVGAIGVGSLLSPGDPTASVVAWSAASVVSYLVLLALVVRSVRRADASVAGRLGA
ncbi:oligosaccharide flippase family protein [Frigoribacterium sp. VKM Ac-2530]|uniref:lipopolysaccharide biosynthesis protein n=1 Tax=Frigoribacterium sp. VKM Ac-2530 TaxID=2783822 RepID=UPI00188D5A76|nr:oligosaccharide flippase family protein [Frigoribacterium sp. VKM Ac-2530]